MWSLPRQGIKPMCPMLAAGLLLSTLPPGKSRVAILAFSFTTNACLKKGREKIKTPGTAIGHIRVIIGGCTERKPTSTLCNAVKLTWTEQSPGRPGVGHSDSKVSPACGTPPLGRKWLSLTWHSPMHRSPKSEQTGRVVSVLGTANHTSDLVTTCESNGKSSAGSGAASCTVNPHWQVTWPEVLSGLCSVIWKACSFKFLSPISGNKWRPHH